jgi:penicillin amidase
MERSESRPAQPRVATDRPRRRAWLRRTLLGLLAGVVVLAVLLAGGAYVFVQRTLPQTSGTLTVPGLQHPASVLRDQWGVPHITGQTVHDVAFTQGYVTAQDRLFQMEFNRRVAAGRLAEMFGPGPDNSLIEADTFLRTLGLYQSAEQERVALSITHPDVLAELQAYADGVNAFLATHRSSLPLEFSILGITPQPWTATDSLAYGRVVALSLDDNWYIKYTRAMVLAKVGPDVTSALFPPYPSENPTLFTASGQAAPLQAAPPELHPASAPASLPAVSAAQRAAFGGLSASVLRGAAVVHALLGNVSDALGSNDWVVDGTRTTTGAPLLANDPHLGISMPAIWYEVGLRGGGLDVLGFSFPGVPGVIIGHNDHIAWGVTNVGADDTDLYLETLDPAGHPGQYEYAGQWLPLQTRREVIKVRGAEPVTITVRSTAHGPLLNSAVSDLAKFTPVSLKWTALQPGYTFAGFFQLDAATDWQQFVAATSNISISQNFVYADTQGNIGYRMSGVLPLRPAANDLLPVDGSTPAYEWQGYVPQDQMPTLFNPSTHIIATANNQIVPEGYPAYVTSTWDQGYRARRIVDLLSATPQLSVADFERIQADVYSIPAAQLVPRLIAAGTAAGGDAATAAQLLRGWDDRMTTSSTAAAVFEVTAGNLLRDTLEPVLGKSLYGIYRSNYSASGLYSVLLGLVADPAAPFFGIAPADPAPAGKRDAALARALAESLGQLRAALGPDAAKWQWGALHTASFAHPLASVAPLDRIFGVAPVATSGDAVTVSIGGDGRFSQDPPSYAQRTISSMRQIIDLSDFDHSLWVIPAGESGEPFSPHYSDLLALWAGHRYQQMEYSAQADAATSVAVLTLQP